ncbi:FimV/HubP family polar landmark protein [Limnobacter sp.]|uniref:FimV/HubP family polar landmark protein n=1 Tax=Limnobacter sp. TaxID=2003368 RepID=UPI00262E0D88|nr:FimV/HubP family polar landmark protein [Limnobacter sp.]
MKHIKQTILPFVFASGLLASTFAQAAQLGKLEVLSGAGEPFLAQIQIDLVTPEERASLQAKLASAEAFKAARLTMDPNLKNLKFAIQDGKQAGTALVKVTADKPLPAGFIDTLVELTWAGGRVAREYTLTIPLGPAVEEKPASTALPEIRPPMTPPPAAAVPSAAEPASKAPPAPMVSQDAPVDSKTGTLQVKRGDTLSELAMELVGDGVSLNQAMAAIYEANKDSFINGSVHLIREGAQIQVPNRTALRAKSANEALLVLANNDDRNVYSAYARQIGLLTVENQSAAASTTSTQGSISPKQKPETNTSAREDRLQIAPSASTSAGKADLNAEELLAKNKALAEANERIALLEKNVSDLQRLLDMQKDLGETPAGESVAPPAAETSGAENDAADVPGVEVPSEALTEDSPETTATETPAAEPSEPAAVEPVPEDAPFDWMPWILAGAGGLVALIVLLLLIRARRNKSNGQEDDSDLSDESSFSEVHEFDDVVAAAGSAIDTDKNSTLNKSENSDFDLDEVLNDRLKPVEPEELTQSMPPPTRVEPQMDFPPATPENDIPELVEASDESMGHKDSLNSEVNLEFPEDDPVKADGSSILDDLDSLEKGALAAQEELDEIRKQPVPEQTPEEFDASAAFDEMVQEAGNPEAGDNAPEQEPTPETGPETVDLDLDVPGPKVDDATWQEVATKLDLAGAYVEIGDADGAKELLNEIVKKGDADQVRKAKALLATLN